MKLEWLSRGGVVMLAVGWLVLACADAHAQQGAEEARLKEAFLTGQQLAREGKYTEAIKYYRVAVELAPRVFGENSGGMAVCLGNLGTAYGKAGQYAQAEPILRRSLQIAEAQLGKDHVDVSHPLNNLAMLYDLMGQYAKAEPLFQRSLRIREAKLGKDHFEVSESLGNLALLFMRMGQHAKAEPLLIRSLQIREAKLGKDHVLVADSLHNLAGLYAELGQHAKARPLLQRTLQIEEANHGKNHHTVAYTLAGLASLHMQERQYAQAELLYQRSLEIFEASLGKDHPHVASILSHLASTYAHRRNHAKAEEFFQRSLQIREAKLGRNHPDLAGNLALLAMMSTAQQRWIEAAALFDRSHRKYVSFFQDTLPTLSTKEQLDFLANHESSLAAPLSLAYSRRKDAKIVEISAAWVLNGKGLTQDALAQSLYQQSGQANAVGRWAELTQVRNALPADSILLEVARIRRYTEVDLPVCYAVWLIPPAGKGQVEIIDLGSAEPIDQAVAAFRTAIEVVPGVIRTEGEPDAEKKALASLQALSKLVLIPMQDKIGSAKQWLISPDAALWLAPWAALPLADGSYAVEKHTISYLISGRELVQPTAVGKPGRARIIADPDFDLTPAAARAELKQLAGNIAPVSDFRAPVLFALPRASRLPGTKTEADAIKPKLDQYIGQETWVYQDRQALEGIIKRVRKPGVLVLSTHGFFLQDQELAGGDLLVSDEKRPALTKDGKPLENPLLRCGLLLAGCNRRDQATQPDDEDGVLTGAEIVGLDLQGTALVVLSACETGVGQVNVGEGVAGLRQAFQLAGAQSVVATLWQIPDRESAQLMAKFFENLAQGQPRAEALRNAQLWMIQTRRDRHGAAHPYFWAAFTLTGKGDLIKQLEELILSLLETKTADVESKVKMLVKDPTLTQKVFALAKDMDRRRLNFEASYVLGQAAQVLKDIKTSETFYRIAAEKAVWAPQPGNLIVPTLRDGEKTVMSLGGLIDLYFENKMYTQTEQVCREFLAVTGDEAVDRLKPAVLKRLIQAIARQGKLDQAMDLLEPRVQGEAQRGGWIWLQLKASILSEHEQFREAVRIHETVIDRIKNDNTFRDGTRDLYLRRAYDSLGDAHLALKNRSKAIEAWKLGLSLGVPSKEEQANLERKIREAGREE